MFLHPSFRPLLANGDCSATTPKLGLVQLLEPKPGQEGMIGSFSRFGIVQQTTVDCSTGQSLVCCSGLTFL